MFVSESILELSRDINSLLVRVDAAVKRLAGSKARPGEEPESLRIVHLKVAEEKIRNFTVVMRADLGFKDMTQEARDPTIKASAVKDH